MTGSTLKAFMFKSLLALLIIASTLVLGEIAVRVFKTFGYSTFVFRQYDPVRGTSLIPGTSGKHQRCFDGYVVVNEGVVPQPSTQRTPGAVTSRITSALGFPSFVAIHRSGFSATIRSRSGFT